MLLLESAWDCVASCCGVGGTKAFSGPLGSSWRTAAGSNRCCMRCCKCTPGVSAGHEAKNWLSSSIAPWMAQVSVLACKGSL